MSPHWLLNRASPDLAAVLREATRLDAIATALAPGAAAATVRRELETRPLAPGRARRRGTSRLRRIERPYGRVWEFGRAPFFATRPVPFLGIPLDGGAVVAFDPRPRPDLGPPAARYALERLAAARGWELATDLGRADASIALLDIALAVPDLFLPAGRPAVGDATVRFGGRWAEGDDDELLLRLEPLALTVSSRRYGRIGGSPI